MIRLMFYLVLPDARLVARNPTDLSRRLRLLGRPVMITHPRERKDICAGRDA